MCQNSERKPEMKFTVYQGIVNNARACIGKTEKECLDLVNSYMEYIREEDGGKIDYEIKPKVMDLPEVLGTLLPDVECPHVDWLCPYCGESHQTDLEPEEESPALWFCENGKGICLIHFKR